MGYLIRSPNGEESLNKCLSPDPYPHPDRVRGKKIKSVGAIVFKLRVRTDIQTDILRCVILTLLSGSEGNITIDYNNQTAFLSFCVLIDVNVHEIPIVKFCCQISGIYLLSNQKWIRCSIRKSVIGSNIHIDVNKFRLTLHRVLKRYTMFLFLNKKPWSRDVFVSGNCSGSRSFP